MKHFEFWAGIVLGFIVGGLFSAFVFTTHAQVVSFQSNLYYGLTNNSDVTALQTFLTQDGDYKGPVTGSFYSLTKAGVIKFQDKHNLPQTGYFGILSRGVANSVVNAQSQQNQSASTEVVQATSTAPASTGVSGNTPSPVQTTTPSVPDQSVPSSGAVSQTTTTTSSTDQTPAGVEQPVTPPVKLFCAFNANVVRWSTGTYHAQFQWSFTDGATAKIITPDGQAVYTQLAPNIKGNIIENPNFNGEQDLYGPSISQDTRYELFITKGQDTAQCDTVANIPNQ